VPWNQVLCARTQFKGAQSAIAAKADEIVIFTAASQTFCRKNINCSIEQSLERYAAVAEVVKENGLRLRGSISCSFGCPYEGDIPVSSVINVLKRLQGLGCDEIDLADTIGVGTVKRVKELITRREPRISHRPVSRPFS